ncbi:hypothetical protein [Streptodolium elevatio]|uniref:Fibronectin type-III domain-containing protein n=1 Tax=Streptodolium elevatio TaxID=3157996 RepID=A0ABV3D817_9ACTN
MLRIRPVVFAGRVRDALKPGRGRTTTAVALGAAGSLIAGMVVAGMGAAGANPDLSDIGAWLASDKKGNVAHVNGLTGQVDGRVKLPRNDDTRLQVSEDGNTVLVLDESTGTVSRIDPSQLTVPQTFDHETPGLKLASGGGKAWLVDAANGQVRPIDPVSLAPLGAPLDVGGKPLGEAQADPAGTLWVPVPSTGQLVPVTGDKLGSPIKVAEPNGALLLTMASGRPVVTDVKGGQMLIVSGNGVERTVKLPEDMAKGNPEKLLAPGLSEGPVVPVLAADTGTLTLVDIDSGSVTAVPLTVPAHDFAPPQVLGAKVYIPDRSAGSLFVYNIVQAKFEDQLKVTGVPGKLEAYVRDGLLWVNDQDSATAAVVNVQGQLQLIGKYENTPGPGQGSATGSTPPTPAKSVPEGGATSSPEESAASSSAPPSGSPDDESTGGAEDPSGDGSGLPPVVPPDVPPVEPPVVPPGPGDDDGGDDPPPSKSTRPDPPKTSEAPKPSNTHRPPDPDPEPSTTPPVDPPKPPDPPTDPPKPPDPPTDSPKPPDPPAPPTTQVPTTPATSDKPTETPSSKPPTTSSNPKPPTTATKPPTTTTKPPTGTTKPPAMKKPGTPVATSGAGKITLMFQPASGATPLRYTVGGTSAGMGVTPASVGPKGPFMFTVTGGSCEKEYRFYITAEYPGGIMNSGWSTAVRPCLPPGKPTNLTATKSGDKAKVTWGAPTNTAGETITYTGSWSVKPSAKTTPKAAVQGGGSDQLTPALYGGLVADPPAVNHPTVADGTDVAAAAAPTKGSWTTTDRSVTLSVGGVSGSYTFKVTAKSKGGSTASAPATLTITLNYGKVSNVTLDAPPELPGSAPYPPTPSPSGPGDGDGAVALAAAIAPSRRPDHDTAM